MSELVRCPACRGAKQVAKLGGIMGKCNTCSGKGQILESEKPKPVLVAGEDVGTSEVMKAVADCVPASSVEHNETPQVKIDGKKAIYRKKKATA